MRTTLTLADDIYEAAKTLAASSGESLGKVISQLARRGLQPQDLGRAHGELAVFSVPATAEVIPGNRADELLAAEGNE